MNRREFLKGSLAVSAVGAVPPCTFAKAPRHDGYLLFDPEVPDLEPRIFAPKILARDRAYIGYQTFDPSGEEFYFAVTDRDWQSSRIRHVSARRPDVVETLQFTNPQWEGEPCIAPDGRRMFFTAILPPGDKPWDSDLYCVERTGAGWGRPRLLPAPVNTAASEWHASVTNDGVLYFASEREGGASCGRHFPRRTGGWFVYEGREIAGGHQYRAQRL